MRIRDIKDTIPPPVVPNYMAPCDEVKAQATNDAYELIAWKEFDPRELVQIDVEEVAKILYNCKVSLMHGVGIDLPLWECARENEKDFVRGEAKKLFEAGKSVLKERFN